MPLAQQQPINSPAGLTGLNTVIQQSTVQDPAPGQQNPVVDPGQPGGGTPPVQAQPTTTTIPLEQFNHFSAMQTRLAQLEAENERRAAETRETEIKALQEKGKFEEAIKLREQAHNTVLEGERRKLRETEEAAKRFALDGELGRALAGAPLVTGGAEQLTRLLRDDFLVEQAGNTFSVRSKDFRPVGEYLGAMLGRPEFSHFLRPNNPGGGTGAGTGTQGSPTPPANQQQAAPATFTDELKHWYQNTGGTPANANATGQMYVQPETGKLVRNPPAAGFGLRPFKGA